MHAIGHYVLEHNPNAKDRLLSSEKFTNEFINSIRDNKLGNSVIDIEAWMFHQLMIFNFLQEKNIAQEEFSRPFNALHEESKQIVISSDRPPREYLH